MQKLSSKQASKQKLFLGILCLTSFSAHAALFQGQSSGQFLDPTGPSGMVTTGVGTANFSWGSGTPSTLGYVGRAFNANENNAFVFGTLNYFNGVTGSGTEANTVNLDVDLSFTTPITTVESFTFNFGLINTPNNSTPENNADIVNFDNTVPANSFLYAGLDYTLQFLGFGTLTGEGFTIENSFRVLENKSASVDLIGRITSTPTIVPVPATGLLFGTALLGLVGLKRRGYAG